jgi:predicted glycosyltransferase
LLVLRSGTTAGVKGHSIVFVARMRHLSSVSQLLAQYNLQRASVSNSGFSGKDARALILAARGATLTRSGNQTGIVFNFYNHS